MLPRIFWPPPKSQNKSKFLPGGLPKICTDNGCMRAGAMKRPARPMNTWKISLSASFDMACAAQIVLKIWAEGAQRSWNGELMARGCDVRGDFWL
jgi:hypothetical protein